MGFLYLFYSNIVTWTSIWGTYSCGGEDGRIWNTGNCLCNVSVISQKCLVFIYLDFDIKCRLWTLCKDCVLIFVIIFTWIKSGNLPQEVYASQFPNLYAVLAQHFLSWTNNGKVMLHLHLLSSKLLIPFKINFFIWNLHENFWGFILVHLACYGPNFIRISNEIFQLYLKWLSIQRFVHSIKYSLHNGVQLIFDFYLFILYFYLFLYSFFIFIYLFFIPPTVDV
jgi:hypothetical protein